MNQRDSVMLIGGELVTCQTDDQIRLNGFFLPPKSSAGRRCSLDGVFLTHAIAGNFYNSRFLNQLALDCQELGLPILVGNNRGHDVVNYVSAAGFRKSIGAAREIVAECTLDIDAWCKLLRGRGCEQIAIVGHSLGAIKAIYSQAHQASANVAGMVCFSASRLSYDDFLRSESKSHFLSLLEKAESLCDSGRGDELMEVDFPFPVLISAKTYVDKYGSASRYNWLNFIDQVKVPTLLAFGEKELSGNAAFQGIISQINELNLPASMFDTRIVNGANHSYSGCQRIAGDTMIEWIMETFPLE